MKKLRPVSRAGMASVVVPNVTDALLTPMSQSPPAVWLSRYAVTVTPSSPAGTFKFFTAKQTAPDVPEVAVSKPGEVYALGKHLLVCGNSTKAEDVAKVCGEKEADLWLTDPPYNVDYHGSDGQSIQNDSMEDSKFRELLRTAFGIAAKALKPGGSFYVFHADSEGYNFRGACFDVGLRVRQCLVWKKNSLVLGRNDIRQNQQTSLGLKNPTSSRRTP